MSGLIERAAKTVREIRNSSLCGICDRWPRTHVRCECHEIAQALLRLALTEPPSMAVLRSCDDMTEDKYLARGRAVDAYSRMMKARLQEEGIEP